MRLFPKVVGKAARNQIAEQAATPSHFEPTALGLKRATVKLQRLWQQSEVVSCVNPGRGRINTGKPLQRPIRLYEKMGFEVTVFDPAQRRNEPIVIEKVSVLAHKWSMLQRDPNATAQREVNTIVSAIQ